MLKHRIPKLTAALVLAITIAALAQDETSQLFKGRCSRCHAIDGSGKTAAGKRMQIPDLRSPKVQRRSDQQLFEAIAHGKDHRNYPHVFSELGLSDQQVQLLVKYIRTLAPGRN